MRAISVAVVRGGIVESRHRVHAVALRAEETLETAGDPELVTFFRSSAKPFQALPLARAVPDLPAAELAVACASHEARDEQITAVRALLARAGATEDELECGAEDGSRLRHNCSGKHAGMLLLAARRGWPRAGYRLRQHPLQQEMLSELAAVTGLREAAIGTATDGCGVVTFALPLRAMATAFSRLAERDAPGAASIVSAMRRHPGIVGGPTAIDTLLMEALPGAVAKRGAEGLLCAALADGTGVALKVEDGAARALPPAVARFLGVADLAEAPLVNSRGELAGSVRVEDGRHSL